MKYPTTSGGKSKRMKIVRGKYFEPTKNADILTKLCEDDDIIDAAGVMIAKMKNVPVKDRERVLDELLWEFRIWVEDEM